MLIYIYIYFYIVTSIIYLYLCLLLFIYMCVCLCVCVWVYVYIFYTHTDIYIYIHYIHNTLYPQKLYIPSIFSRLVKPMAMAKPLCALLRSSQLHRRLVGPLRPRVPEGEHRLHGRQRQGGAVVIAVHVAA